MSPGARSWQDEGLGPHPTRSSVVRSGGARAGSWGARALGRPRHPGLGTLAAGALAAAATAGGAGADGRGLRGAGGVAGVGPAVPLVGRDGGRGAAGRRACPRDTGATYRIPPGPGSSLGAPDPFTPLADELGPSIQWGRLETSLAGPDPSRATDVVVLFREGALDHVDGLEGSAQPGGVWLSDRAVALTGAGRRAPARPSAACRRPSPASTATWRPEPSRTRSGAPTGPTSSCGERTSSHHRRS